MSDQLLSQVEVSSLGEILLRLVSNSLDSGAKNIACTADLDAWTVRVLDNGHGLAASDLAVIAKKHHSGHSRLGNSLWSILNLADISVSSGAHQVHLTRASREIAGPGTFSRAAKGCEVFVFNVFDGVPVRRRLLEQANRARTVGELRGRLLETLLGHPETSVYVETVVAGATSTLVDYVGGVLDVRVVYSSVYGESRATQYHSTSASYKQYKLEGLVKKGAGPRLVVLAGQKFHHVPRWNGLLYVFAIQEMGNCKDSGETVRLMVEKVIQEWKDSLKARPAQSGPNAIQTDTSDLCQVSVESSHFQPPPVFPRTGYRVISQFMSRFILVKASNDLFIFDQHAAHERVLVESLLQDFVASLDTPVKANFTLDVSSEEKQLVQQYQSTLGVWGLSLEWNCGLQISTLPQILLDKSEEFVKLLILGHCNDILQVKKNQTFHVDTAQWWNLLASIPQPILELVNSKACKSAIKFGDVLNLDQCVWLIGKLSKCKFKYICAHGRPTIIHGAQLKN